MPQQTTHHTGAVHRDGVRIHYDLYGDGEVTLLLPPAWAITDSTLWRAQVAAFPDRYRVITFDPRGNGRSDRPTDAAAYAVPELVADLVAVLDATRTREAVVVGNSFGCVLAYLTAALHPDRVAGAVLLDGSSLVLDGRDDDPFQHALATFDDPPTGNEGWALLNAEWFERDYGRFVRFFAHTAFPEPHARPIIDEAVRVGRQTNGTVLAAAIRARGKAPVAKTAAMLRSLLPNIACPVRVLHGDLDRIAPLHRDQAIAKALGTRLTVIPGAGHCPQATFPEQVNTIIDDFVTTHCDR